MPTALRSRRVGHVQADELYVKAVGRRLWMATAMAVPSRLWRGGVVSARRDPTLITAVVPMDRRAASGVAFLVGVDGLASYVTAFVRGFRNPVRTGKAGRPRLRRSRLAAGPGDQAPLGPSPRERHPAGGAGDGRGDRRGAGGDRHRDGDQYGVHRAAQRDVPRRAEPAVRRGRALVRGEAALTGGMYLVGCAYNFCWEHDSLRIAAPPGERLKWRDRTPAMAAGLTDHRGTMRERLGHPIR